MKSFTTTHKVALNAFRPVACSLSFFPTASDFTHGSDGRIVRWDAAEGFGLYRSIAGDPQHQSEQALVPTEGLLGQLAAWQRGGEGQMELGGGKPRAEE